MLQSNTMEKILLSTYVIKTPLNKSLLLQVHMEYIRVRQNAEVKTNQHDLKKIITPLDLGSKAKMKGSARHSTSPLQLGTLLNFCLLVAACIIISCTLQVNFYKTINFSLSPFFVRSLLWLKPA